MISVIISTLTGGATYLSSLLPDLSREPDSEIIVIDNNSRDGTLQLLSNYNCLIKVNTSVKTFAESNNLGASYAKGEELLFLNNDTRICSGILAEMKNTLYSSRDVGAVGCLLKLMDQPHRIQHAGVYFTHDFIPYELGLPLPFGIPELPAADPRVESVREVPSVTAACMMMRKEVFNQLGGFDERYKNGWEDTDICLKARENGYKIMYTGKACAFHKHFGSRDRGRFTFENQNRQLYDSIWVEGGRAKKALENYIEPNI